MTKLDSSYQNIEIGQFRISERDDGTYWICVTKGEAIGEGMQTSVEKLKTLLEAFWKEEF